MAQENSDEEFEPNDDDAYLIDVGRRGWEVVVEQKSLGVFNSQDKAEQKLVEWIAKNKVYPSVYWVSDHGNTHPYTLDTKYQEEIDEAMRNANHALEVRSDEEFDPNDDDAYLVDSGAFWQAFADDKSLGEFKSKDKAEQKLVEWMVKNKVNPSVWLLKMGFDFPQPYKLGKKYQEEIDEAMRNANPALEVRDDAFNPLYYESGVFQVKDENDEQTDESGQPLEIGWYYWLRLGRTKESDKLISAAFSSKGAAMSALNKQIDAERENWEAAQGRAVNPALSLRWARAGEMDEVGARELALWCDNDSTLQNQYKSIITNLARKYAKGVYNKDLAIKLWTYLTDNGAKSYSKGSKNEFTPATRREAARILEELNFDSVQDQSLDYGQPQGGQRSANPALEMRMRGTDIVGYTYDADFHSIKATKKAWKDGRLKEVNKNGRRDENGIPEDLEDSDGNMVHPVFAGDEDWEESDFDDRSANPALEMRDSDILVDHQLNIARKTVKMHNAFLGVMGGMSKQQAWEVLLKHGKPKEKAQAKAALGLPDGAERSLFGRLDRQVWYKGAGK